MDRIKYLRDRAFDSIDYSHVFFYHFYDQYDRLADLPETERYSEAFYYAFDMLPPSISDKELIVGKRNAPASPELVKDWHERVLPIANARIAKSAGGQDSHMSIDYELVLSEGLYGIINRIDTLKKNCDEGKLSFYNSCKRCLEAVINHSNKYSDLALEMANETEDAVRKAELEKIAEICKSVPANPAKTFYEAVQSVNFISHCVSLNPLRMNPNQFQLGHPDRYLLKYYEKDLADGILTKEDAQILLDCMGIQINMRIPNGVSCGYLVGGRDRNGNLVQNDLTEMGMQVVDDIRLVYPAVGLCFADGMDDKYLKKACEILSKGLSHPAIFNDDIIAKGLMSYGLPEDEAHDYIHSTCVEITPVASSNVWVASPYSNLAQMLLDLMDREYNTFEQLLEAMLNSIDRVIKINFEEQNKIRKKRNDTSLNPLLSCLVNDCLDRGLDIEQGGARYNWIMPSFVGMGNLVDSLYAIKTLVFDEKRLTLTEYLDILKNNYKDNETLRQHILNNIPKYGNDIDDVDKYYRFFSEHIVEECKKYKGMHSNGDLIPSVFCWIRHEQFGRATIATPDGRVAHFPLGDGSGPCQGREMNGPTASVLSSTKWDHSQFIGGVAVNLKFSKASLGSNSIDTMMAIIKTYLQRGGFELQINVVDNETLRKAQENPEQYKDLVVRIGGYSDYFVRLSREMQEEVILRTAHNA